MYAALLAVSASEPNPEPYPKQCGNDWIKHDAVQSLPQQDPVTFSAKAAAKFQPTLLVVHGCHPYPAVNVLGQTNSGLQPSGRSDGKCKGSGLGDQVYARSGWYEDSWGIMYAWYEPKDGNGHRHDWEYVVLWTGNPEDPNAELLAVTTIAAHGRIKTIAPGAEFRVGSSVKLEYDFVGERHAIALTSKEGGKLQTLITWEQLPDIARCALNNATWNEGKVMPLSDAVFPDHLGKAWPFDGRIEAIR
uniref:Necrosis inducing protein (NPP1) n=1 Tax=Peronospora matthiolae TaxID=2874970 RepID=A0AAV1VMB9_9STRA